VPIGRVRTGVAVREGEPTPATATPEGLRDALLSAPAIYFPDAERSTAGIHFASVLQRLGIAAEVAGRLRTFPNGATAMRELASGPTGAIGCTQISEIKATPGIALVGPLPPAFELATVYSAAFGVNASQVEHAARLIDLLAGSATGGLRIEAGFEAWQHAAASQ
jgi:molybdate transport system substrate-binding protein